MAVKNKTMLKLTLLILTFSQMACNGLSPALSGVAAQFPNVSASTVQLLMTLPCICGMLLSLVAAQLTSVFPKKYLIGLGSICVIATGALGFCIHGSLALLYVWSLIMGTGMGLISALVLSMISDFFSGQEKATLMGLQTTFATLGGMIMTSVGGILTAIAWHYDYLVYLIAVPGLILLIFFVPKTTPEMPSPAASDSPGGFGALLRQGKMWMYLLLVMLGLFLFNVSPTNLSMYVEEFALGNSVVSGWAATVFLLGGAVMGMAFGAISKRIGVFTIPLGFVLTASGCALLLSGADVAHLYAGCLISGMSISMIAPQCILQASFLANSSQQLAMSAAIIMAASNTGTFLTPLITAGAQALFGSGSTFYRFLLTMLFAVVMAFVSAVVLWRSRRADVKRETSTAQS